MSIKNITNRYVDIKSRKLSNSSMIRMFDILQDENNTYFMNIFKNFDINVDILNDPSDTTEIGIKNPWWENISYSYYGDVDIWWLGCLSSNILNPFEEIVVGGTLTMITKDYIPDVQRDMEVIFNL